MSVSEERIRSNLASVKHRIAQAAERSGRSADAVRLVAVTKYVGAEDIRMLAAAGCSVFGESRPQVLWEKAVELEDQSFEWHFIGNLQRNKVRRTLPLISLLHAGDSLRLIESVNSLGKELQRTFDLLIEINVSGDAGKHGFEPDTVEPALIEIAELQHVRVCGLMTMASLAGGTDQAGRDFESLRLLRDRLAASAPDSVSLAELSMGMSGDFEAAIEQGATMVRVGSALFSNG